MSILKHLGLTTMGVALCALLPGGYAQAAVCPLPSQEQVFRGGSNPSPLNQTLVFDLAAPIYKTKLVDQTVYDLVPHCREMEVYGGRSHYWDAFYRANRYEKADALADAIRGVGYLTAKKLVRDGTFDRKPRTWREFSDQIYRADRRYRTGFSREVLETYGEENQRRLGYSSLRCWTTKEPRTVQVPVTVFSRCASRRIKVRIENSLLAQDEYESITAHFDGYEDGVQLKSNSNRYQSDRTESSGSVDYTFTASRTRMRPMNRLRLDVSRAPSEALKVVVTFAGWEDSAIEAGYAQIEGTLTCGRAWNRKSFPFTRKLSGVGATTELTLASAPGECIKPNIKYALRIVDSPNFMKTESILVSRDYDI